MAQIDTQQIKAGIKEFVKNNFMLGAENFAFTDDDSFLEKGIIDSTGILELVTFVETTHGFKVKDEELVPDNLDSINKLTAFVASRLALPGEQKAG